MGINPSPQPPPRNGEGEPERAHVFPPLRFGEGGQGGGVNKPKPPSDLPRLLLESVGVAWLAVVAAQYAMVMLVPDPPDLSHAYLPLLASTLITGIISYRRMRSIAPSARPTGDAPTEPAPDSREIAHDDEQPD
jgi:hypothetical protein